MQVFRRFFRPLLVVAMLLTALPVAAAPAYRPEQTGPAMRQEALATLDPVQGLIQYRAASAGPADWLTVTHRMLIAEGDWIRTDALGLATLTFFEGIQAEILPNTVVQISQLDQPDADSVQITLNTLVGDMHHQINTVLDDQSSYEVHTPNAAIAVRGTDFWTSLSWLLELRASAVLGVLAIQGITPTGLLGASALIQAGQALSISAAGELGPLGPITTLPRYPPTAPLAPASAGNGVCEPDLEEANSVDCVVLPTCGDKVCQLESGEGPITCEADCVPGQPFTPPVVQPVLSPTPSPVPVPCTVEASRRDVAMRVGPGYNRGIRDYLAANTPFPVIGQAAGDDGSLWWQIEIAGVPQAWVDQKDVAASGDCAHVGEAAAPPLIMPRPSPAPTGAGGTPSPATTGTPVLISFRADDYLIDYGQCTTVRWDVEGILQVYYEGLGVVGHSYSVECPRQNTTYTLTVILLDGTTVYRYVTIQVLG